MLAPDPKLVTLQFNEAINGRHREGLVALMTEDHCFTDSEGNKVHGRDAVEAAWRGFFSAFPDYHNVFVTLASRGDRVFVLGHSVCSVPALDGPAIWTALIREGRVAEWRVYADNAETRNLLGLQNIDIFA